MKVTTERQKLVNKALSVLIPQVPFLDAEAIRTIAHDRKLRSLPPSIAVWIATVSYVRHTHTDYDQLLQEGYDRESARFFVLDPINSVLTQWRTTRLLDVDDEDTPD